MQTIIKSTDNIHEIFNDIERVYTLTSDYDEYKLIRPCFDNSFKMLIDAYRRAGYDYDVDFKQFTYKPIDKIDNGKNIIVCFTGGKDSIATALYYMNSGYNVYLYYLKHINVSLSDECNIAKECADYLGLPIFFDDIKLKGLHMWMEHPMKNMIIANGALQYGIRNNICTRIAFGNYKGSLLEYSPFDRCAGDCVDMWDTYNNIIQRVLPDFHIHLYLESPNHTLSIVTKDRDLLDRSISCLCRHSLRPYRHKWVFDKFKISLPTHRCGSCYKCCVEYIYMVDHGYSDYSEEYYKYCLNQLYKVAVEEDADVMSIFDVWDYFFSYSFEESKLSESFFTCEVGGRNLKWK